MLYYIYIYISKSLDESNEDIDDIGDESSNSESESSIFFDLPPN